LSDNHTFIRWDATKINEFHSILNTKQCDFHDILNRCNSDDINSLVISFTQVLNDCSHKVFGSTYKTKTNNYNKKPWFNSDCFTARKEFKKARNVFVKNKSNINYRQ
jgi:hypothetical protein